MCFPSLWVETKKTKKSAVFFCVFVFFSFFCKVGKYLKDKKKKKKSSEHYQSLILSLNICIKSQNICLGLIFLLEHERQIEVFTWWCIHPHNEVTSRLLFSISDEFKYFSPFTLFINSNSAELHRIIFFSVVHLPDSFLCKCCWAWASCTLC